MCLLTFLPAGAMPDTGALLNGAYINDHGHGFAIAADDRIITERGLDAEPIVAAFSEARVQHPDGPALFHSRLATHGERGLDNCHPFPVGGDARTVLAHNGILPKLVQPAKGDPRSDTRIAAEDFLPLFGPLRRRQVRLQFERWLTPANMMVILTVDRRFKQRAYILNEQSGIWDDGIWYSNDTYLPLPDPAWAMHDAGWDLPPWNRLDPGAGRCGFCHAVIDPTRDTQCPYCGWCVDCGQLPADCLCYQPAALDQRFGVTPHRLA